MKKSILVPAAVAVLSMSTSLTALAGWTQDSRGYQYKREDGSYVRNDWLEFNQIWYHFDASGYCETGWIWADGYWWYQNADGSYACNGSQVIDGTLYSFDENGHLKETSEHEQKIQHIRDVYNYTNSRRDLHTYGGGTCINYTDGESLVKAVLRNDLYLTSPYTTVTLPVVEYYYEQLWQAEYGYYTTSLVFAYGTDGINEYRYYYQNGNLIREIGPDGVVHDYPAGEGFQKSTNGNGVYSRGSREIVLFAEDYWGTGN